MLFKRLTLSRYPTRAQVESANQLRLSALPGETYQYNATDAPGINSNGTALDQKTAERVLERLVVPKTLQFKVCLFTL
jgi:hypothetical protein